MIDLDRLDASLDLALSDEVRAHRATPTADGATPVTTDGAAPDRVIPARVIPDVRSPTAVGDRAPRPHRRRSAPTPPVTPLSVAPVSPPAPADAVWADLDSQQHSRAVVELLGQAKLAEADLHIAAHADLGHDATRLGHRGDAVGWTVMRALLDGRESAARAGIEQAQALDPAGGAGEHRERVWSQRFAIALTWGDEDERYDVLDHSRERAYGHGDLAWHGRLTLLLAVLGRAGEARREFDSVIGTVLSGPAGDMAWLDRATDLAEAAAVLGDSARGEAAVRSLARVTTPPVAVSGRAWVCKGSVDRYRALASASAGRVDDADRCFRSAAEIHRLLGADAHLARTLRQWGTSLVGRDPQRSVQLLRQGADLAHRLGLADDGPAVHAVAAHAC
ncbi:MAG: hypothetical protein ACR2LJ_04665 [Acidimicrobiales bacterium]